MFIHGRSGGVGSSLLKLLVSMREVKPECKDMKLVATCSSNGAEKILKEIGVDLVVNRRDPNYMQQVKEVNSGKGPDVVFEMLANVNLPSDLVGDGDSFHVGSGEQGRRGHRHRRPRSGHD